jgi:hypothetical protein
VIPKPSDLCWVIILGEEGLPASVFRRAILILSDVGTPSHLTSNSRANSIKPPAAEQVQMALKDRRSAGTERLIR